MSARIDGAEADVVQVVPMRKVVLSEFGVRLLAEHARTLPLGSEARAYLRLLVLRYARAKTINKIERIRLEESLR